MLNDQNIRLGKVFIIDRGRYFRFFGLVVILILSFTSISLITTDNSVDALDYNDLFNGGDGSSTDPWQISNADQLKNIQNVRYSNEYYYVLTNDISLSGVWESLCKDGFQGIFDGGYYSISNLNCNGGLFNEIGTKGVVKNLVLSASISTTGFAGGIVDTCYGTVESCKVTGSITVSPSSNVNSWKYAGGIVGISEGATITSCQNSATVLCNAHPGVSGGIAGLASNTKIINCINDGKIFGVASHYVPAIFDTDETAVAGGIVGHSKGAVSITNCLNCANIDANSNSAEYRFFNAAGGIVGTNSGTISLSDTFSIDTPVIVHYNNKEEFHNYLIGYGNNYSGINYRTISDSAINSSSTYVNWPSDEWSIVDGSIPQIRWISGVNILSTSPAHFGMKENLSINLEILFNTGSSEIKTMSYAKNSPNATQISVRYASFFDSASISPLKVSGLSATSSGSQIFTIGTLSKDDLLVEAHYDDGVSNVLSSSEYSVRSPNVSGEGQIIITSGSYETTINGYFHNSDEYGVLIFPYESKEPLFFVCKKGQSITIPSSEIEEKKSCGWYSEPKNGVLITESNEYTPTSSIILYEQMKEQNGGDSGGIFDGIINFFKNLFSSIASFFSNIYHSIRDWIDSLFNMIPVSVY